MAFSKVGVIRISTLFIHFIILTSQIRILAPISAWAWVLLCHQWLPMFGTVTFCCTLFIMVVSLPMFCTFFTAIFCSDLFHLFRMVLAPNCTSGLGCFPTDLFCGGIPIGCELWFPLWAAEYIMLSVFHNKTGLLENPIKVVVNSDYRLNKSELDVCKQCETG